MTIIKVLVIIIVAIINGFAGYKELKALLSFKKMPDFINEQSKPVIMNSIVLIVMAIFLTVFSLAFWYSYIYFVLLLVGALTGIETCFFIDDELHDIIGK